MVSADLAWLSIRFEGEPLLALTAIGASGSRMTNQGYRQIKFYLNCYICLFSHRETQSDLQHKELSFQTKNI